MLRRQMEVYAGFLAHTDHQIGRFIDALEELGILEDTLIYVIIGDNGASAEGRSRAPSTKCITVNGLGDLETAEFLNERIDKLGAPKPTTTTRSAGRTR